MMPPCVPDCPGRSPTCHTTCEAYKRYREKQEAILKKQQLEREVIAASCEGMWRKSRYGPQF